MYFSDKPYVLDNVTSKYFNPLHQDLIGKRCILRYFKEEEFGLFQAEFDDGWHRISTSIVKRVSADDGAKNVDVATSNSVYTFKLLNEQEADGGKETKIGESE